MLEPAMSVTYWAPNPGTMPESHPDKPDVADQSRRSRRRELAFGHVNKLVAANLVDPNVELTIPVGYEGGEFSVRGDRGVRFLSFKICEAFNASIY